MGKLAQQVGGQSQVKVTTSKGVSQTKNPKPNTNLCGGGMVKKGKK